MMKEKEWEEDMQREKNDVILTKLKCNTNVI